MRVIMSMNVLMPSWSYSLLMSNVLFKPSLGVVRPEASRHPGASTTRMCDIADAISQSVSQFRRGPPAHTTPPSQRTAPLPSVNTSTVLSTRSLGRLNFASEVGLSQHSALRVIVPGARCPILPGGIVLGNQVGGGGRGVGLGLCQPSLQRPMAETKSLLAVRSVISRSPSPRSLVAAEAQ